MVRSTTQHLQKMEDTWSTLLLPSIVILILFSLEQIQELAQIHLDIGLKGPQVVKVCITILCLKMIFPPLAILMFVGIVLTISLKLII